MVCRLAKELIVPKANPSIPKQLASNHPKGRIPYRIVKSFCDPPMP
jgi:hypothetical protein